MFQSAVGNLGIQHVNQYLQAGNYSHSYGNQTALVQGQSPYSGTSAIFYPNANSIIGTNPSIVLMQLYIPNSNRWIDIYINVADVGTINYINTYLQAAFLPKSDPIPTDSGNGDFSIEEIEKAQEIFRELETATGLP